MGQPGFSENPIYFYLARRNQEVSGSRGTFSEVSRGSHDTRTLESNHSTIKSLIKLMLGFQSIKRAYTTIKGSKGMPMAENGQFSLWIGVASGGTKCPSAVGCSASMSEP